MTNGSRLTQIHNAVNLLFLQHFHGELVSCYSRLDSICSICLAQMIWSELRAHRNICDAGHSSLMTDGISILHEGSGLTGVSDLSVKLQSGAQRGGTHWVELKLLFSNPSGLSQWPPVPSRSAVQLSAPTHSTSPPTPYTSIPGPVAPSRSRCRLFSSCPATPGLTIALPCQLQVCQPWACQITVSINSGGGRARMKREMGECGRPRSGESRGGRVGLEEMERM